MIDRVLLKESAAALGVTVDDTAAERLDVYARLLVEWNERMNLTAITDPEGIVLKHFADSLSAAPLLPQGAFSLIDVGTGAGFPGVPLAILRGDMQLTIFYHKLVTVTVSIPDIVNTVRYTLEKCYEGCCYRS